MRGDPTVWTRVDKTTSMVTAVECLGLCLALGAMLCVTANPVPTLPGKDLKFEMKENDAKNPLPIDRLKPPDHMDAVKMEQDGHVNKEYHRELFLGDHENIENDPNADLKLKDIFFKVDTDADQKLSEAEMEAWILQKMEQHFDESLQENEEIFKHLDPDGDGKVHWREYYTHFLLAKGYPPEKAQKHVVDYDEIELDGESRDELIRYKFRWTDADQDPVDNYLNKHEFLTFRHPEESERSMANLVKGVMGGLDSNRDGIITEDEFAAMPPGEVEGEEFKDMDLRWQSERRKEFQEVMDTDKNGKVNMEELKNYLNPKNPVQAKLEARSLLSLIDDNNDRFLSLAEIMKHRDIFITSKVMNYAANIHDEF